MFFKGILIGLLFGVPVGAVGAMTVQRTWEHGTLVWNPCFYTGNSNMK